MRCHCGRKARDSIAAISTPPKRSHGEVWSRIAEAVASPGGL